MENSEHKIIKKIHYVWLGGNPLPPSVKYCIDSWKKYCPDYEIMQWNESNFDVNKYPWCREAIERKRYAFASDLVRLFVLKEYGGLYLDTDVELLANPDKYINHSFVAGIENLITDSKIFNQIDEKGYLYSTGKRISHFGINTGFIYAQPNHQVTDYMIDKTYMGGVSILLIKTAQTMLS